MRYINNRVKECISTVTVLISLLLIVSGCASTKGGPEAVNELPALRTVDLYFESPIVIEAPQVEPVTVEEHIRAGLFLFKQADFRRAAEEFEEALLMIEDKDNRLYRSCLISIAVSKLIVSDIEGFMRTVEELESVYNPYQLMAARNEDGRINTLFNLYDKYMQRRQYREEVRR